MNDQLAQLLRDAAEIDRAAQPVQQSTPPTTPPDAAPAAGGASDGQEMDVELVELERRLRAAHDERQRNANTAATNERLLAEALASRGIREHKPDTASNADTAPPLRLDGTTWSAADVRTARELEKYLPGIDLLGSRVPPGFRRS
jgi:hypothetical protein